MYFIKNNSHLPKRIGLKNYLKKCNRHLFSFRRKLHYLFELNDIFALMASLCVIIITILAYYEMKNRIQTTIIYLGIIYLLIILTGYIKLVKKRQLKDYHKRETFEILFQFMNDELFQSSSNTRITLFVPDPLSNKYIIPYARFRVGTIPNTKEILKSKARFSEGEGLAGQAWKKINPANNALGNLVVGHFPTIDGTFDKMRELYCDYDIPEDIINNLSDYMLNVKSIICLGFLGTKQNLNAVLCIDHQDSILKEDPSNSDQIILNIDLIKFENIVGLINSYLNKIL